MDSMLMLIFSVDWGKKEKKEKEIEQKLKGIRRRKIINFIAMDLTEKQDNFQEKI